MQAIHRLSRALVGRMPGPLGALDPRFIVFLGVGALNTAFGYALFAGLVALLLPIPLAMALSTVLGVLFNFKTTGRLVFASRNNALLARFFLAYALSYTINLAALKGLMALGLGVYPASAALLAPMAVLSFVLNKRFVFRGSP